MPKSPPSLEARPPAKINLTLEILGRRPDGYHALRSVFLRLGLSDRLTVQSGRRGTANELTVSGSSLPDENTVRTVLALLEERFGPDLVTLRAHLIKVIPIGAGLGGGSSDAATMITLADKFWGLGMSQAEKEQIGQAVGSDVPFFLGGASAAMVEGRGEQLTPLPGIRGEAAVLLAIPDFPLDTPAVYGRYDELGESTNTEAPSVSEALADDLRAGLDGPGLASWARRLRDANDLWPAAWSIKPDLGVLRVFLEATTDTPWMMSGSGSTLFSLYGSRAEASAARTAIEASVAAELPRLILIVDDLVNPDPIGRNQ
ncbi:MAG: 4-(cytidine 5'-diphospho)-2-C-methyl-D-erythritol kinase [Chloroflexota bacterium]